MGDFINGATDECGQDWNNWSRCVALPQFLHIIFLLPTAEMYGSLPVVAVASPHICTPSQNLVLAAMPGVIIECAAATRVLRRRCKLCVLPSLVMANQHLWSIHPANPFNASEPFGAGKRVPALDRIHKAWDLFTKACAPHTQPTSLL